MNPNNYRPNVCAVILHPYTNDVLFCHRRNFSPNEGWQFPQGGVDPTLSVEIEMFRELREEIGTDAVSVLLKTKNEYYYDFPTHILHKRKTGYCGQRQQWILCRFTGSLEDINVNTLAPEFDTWKWVAPVKTLKMVVAFKQTIYQEALAELGLI